MYIRRSAYSKNGKTYSNYLLVESVRTPSGPRQKTICSLGDLHPRSALEWLKLAHHVEAALLGQLELIPSDDPEVKALLEKARPATRRPVNTDRISPEPTDKAQEVPASTPPPKASESPKSPRPDKYHPPPAPRSTSTGDLVAVRTDDVRTERHREAGATHVGLCFYRRLGIDELLANVGLTQRSRALACLMVLNRLIEPSSEHAMPAWAARTALGELLAHSFEGLDENALYRTMDRLHPHIQKVEKQLWERSRNLFNLDSTIYLYDLTSTYFEGQAKGMKKAARGYSRDSRPDCKQVVIGLVLNRDGFPIAHEIFAGNTQDRASLGAILERLKERVGLSPETTVVVDRGMAYESNLAELRARNVRFLVAARHPERDQFLKEFEELEEFESVIREPSPRNPFQKKSQVRVKLLKKEGMTYVLCLSSERIAKDRAIREKHEARLLADFGRLQSSVNKGKTFNAKKLSERIGRLKERYPRVARYYRMTLDEEAKTFTWTVDEPRRARAEELDGSYLLKTERTDLTAGDAWRTYTLLTRVENAFRCMKTPLNERPIFHQLDRRMETHIFLCLLAYWLLISIEKTLLDKGIHTSWLSVRDTVKTHQVCTMVLPLSNGQELHIRRGSTPEPAHRRLYEALDVPLEVMTTKRDVR